MLAAGKDVILEVDSIVTRGLKNTFRFGPGFGIIAKTAIETLDAINEQAGKPAKTVMIVHEDSLFGSGLAKLLNAQLPQQGFEILETIPHPTPTRDFNNVVLKIKAQNPDLVIPANYYNEYVLLARTMQQQQVKPKGIYSVLGGGWPGDKWVDQFFVNDSHLAGNSWIKLRLRGHRTNYYGVGARISVYTADDAGTPIVRRYFMDAGTGFGSKPYLAHIGLYKAKRVDRVEVYWPVSRETRVYHPEILQTTVLDENDGSIVTTAAR